MSNSIFSDGISGFIHMNQASILTGVSNYAINYFMNHDILNYPTVVPIINLPLSAGVYMALIAAVSVMPGIAVGSQAGAFITKWVGMDLGSQTDLIEGAAGSAAIQLAAWEFINPLVISFQGGLGKSALVAAGSYAVGTELTKRFPVGS